MSTALITHLDCLEHVTPQGHPEQVARLEVILKALADKDLQRVEAPLATDEQILRVHPAEHLAAVRAAVPEKGIVQIEADTYMSPGSLTAALRGAGGAALAVDMVLAGEVKNAFVACRPPGHHAEQATPMGFCLFGTVAIAALQALEVHGLSRVAIMDFDVHHGNGTQDLIENDARIFFCSSHQMPLYPGTGAASETGGHGNVLNIPLADGTNSQDFRAMMSEQVIPALRDFNPELIIISAGFDAHRADPLAGLNLETEDFAWATEQLCDLADECCSGRLVSSLEGGYDLDALAQSTAAHVDVLIRRSVDL